MAQHMLSELVRVAQGVLDRVGDRPVDLELGGWNGEIELLEGKALLCSEEEED